MRALALLGVSTAYAGIATTAAIALRIGLSAPAGPARSLSAFTPVVLVIAAAAALLYVLLFTQSATAFGEHSRLKREAKCRGEKPPTLAEVKYGGRYEAILAADRCMGNYLEQLVPFLISLLGYAIYVSANHAAAIGWAWIVFRSYYPFVYVLPFPALLTSTMPAYCCLWWMLGMTVYSAVSLP